MTEHRDAEVSEDEVDARLARLRAATEHLPAPAALPDRVLRAIQERRSAGPASETPGRVAAPSGPGLAEVILLSSRRAVAVAAVAAAAAVAMGLWTEADLVGAAADRALDGDLDGSLALSLDALSDEEGDAP